MRASLHDYFRLLVSVFGKESKTHACINTCFQTPSSSFSGLGCNKSFLLLYRSANRKTFGSSSGCSTPRTLRLRNRRSMLPRQALIAVHLALHLHSLHTWSGQGGSRCCSAGRHGGRPLQGWFCFLLQLRKQVMEASRRQKQRKDMPLKSFHTWVLIGPARFQFIKDWGNFLNDVALVLWYCMRTHPAQP